jgi:acyl carrier protein phosphodiesterase
MNYLAHAYFSSSNLQRMGNLLADFYRKSEITHLPLEIQSGIFRHRKIDDFTDHHPEILKAKTIFAPLVGRYSGAFVDVSLDYFLANDAKHTEQFWRDFAQETYRILEENKNYWPQKFEAIYPNMVKNNWLYHYRFDWAIEYSFNNLFAKAKYLDKNPAVFEAFLANLPALKDCYEIFIEDLKLVLVEMS